MNLNDVTSIAIQASVNDAAKADLLPNTPRLAVNAAFFKEIKEDNVRLTQLLDDVAPLLNTYRPSRQRHR